MKVTFSERYGYHNPEPPITIRNDAPVALRQALTIIAEQAGLQPSQQRKTVCSILLKQPDRNNWSEYPNIWNEVNELVDSCPWCKVYDIAEAFYQELAQRQPWDPRVHEGYENSPPDFFVKKLNGVLLEHGIGWNMTKQGVIEFRSNKFSDQAIQHTQQILVEKNMPKTCRELSMAMEALSRRPESDVTGVVQHATAALEGLVREITGTTKTLGQAAKELQNLGIPPALVRAISALYGYASEPKGGGRHGSEKLQVDRAEAQLVFHLCAALATYLSDKVEGQ